MREEILAAIVRGDEAEAFGIVEPLDCTCCHISYPKKMKGDCPTVPSFEYPGPNWQLHTASFCNLSPSEFWH
jgi:hypothetical protein